MYNVQFKFEKEKQKKNNLIEVEEEMKRQSI